MPRVVDLIDGVWDRNGGRDGARDWACWTWTIFEVGAMGLVTTYRCQSMLRPVGNVVIRRRWWTLGDCWGSTAAWWGNLTVVVVVVVDFVVVWRFFFFFDCFCGLNMLLCNYYRRIIVVRVEWRDIGVGGRGRSCDLWWGVVWCGWWFGRHRRIFLKFFSFTKFLSKEDFPLFPVKVHSQESVQNLIILNQ